MKNKKSEPTVTNYPYDQTRTVIGMISGTSADGVDVVRVKFSPVTSGQPPEVQFFRTVPYPKDLKQQILDASADKLSLRQTAVLNTKLGEFFAQVALNSMNGAHCHLIASHGQTVCHLPEQRTTLQLGEGSIIANRTGVLTVSDFRTADMALGGQGAPLVPLFDAYLLSSQEKTRIAVNLGGIANITIIEPGNKSLLAWDTGPANSVSDALCRLHGRGDYDPSGDMAAKGRVNEELLSELLKMEYFHRSPPKSTGLEDFGLEFAQKLPDDLSFEDLLRTALAFSAQTLADAIFTSLPAGCEYELVFAGGGTSNITLVKEIESRLNEGAEERGFNEPVFRLFSEFGVAEEAREAVAFAYLGDRTLRGLVGTLPSTTGARKAAILGKISFPSP